mmetsp:Transcript_52788/g.112150  ORF Transcript_52788/g.112150 Transcript_52788/m.112150 type:complete len:217 (+) Transcript_52788:270-920(+)
MNTFPPLSPSPYTGSGTLSLLLNRNPMSFPPSLSTGSPVLRLYVAPQKSHASRASPPVSSFPSRTLAFDRGILHDAHPEEKQYVLSPWLTIDTAPAGLVFLSTSDGTFVSTSCTESLSWGREDMEGMVVWAQLLLAVAPWEGSDPAMDCGLLRLSPPTPESPFPRLAMERAEEDDDCEPGWSGEGAKPKEAAGAPRRRRAMERFMLVVVEWGVIER